MSKTVDIEKQELLPFRPVREAVSEIVGMGLVSTFIACMLLAFPGGSAGIDRAIGLAPELGLVVLGHIGWAVGAYVPILLGFYVVVIGGQLVPEQARAGRIRRSLGLVAEAMMGALVPALLLIFIACAHDPKMSGALFVIMPVSAVMFFLAIQLGSFVAFEDVLRLAAAKESRDWATERLASLRRRPARSFWAVMVVHAVVGGAVGLGIAALFAIPIDSPLSLFLLYAATSLILGAVFVHGVYTFRTARDRSSRLQAWLLPTILYAAGCAVVVQSLHTTVPAAAVSVFAVLGGSAVSALSTSERTTWRLMSWTLHAAGCAVAARSVSRLRERSNGEIADLSTRSTANGVPSLRGRLATAIRAFREAEVERAVVAEPQRRENGLGVRQALR